ncbi:hypothetical protein ACWEKM_34675 [Streptomyces sp. NPDC004752]
MKSVAGAALLTLVTVVVTLLLLMFSTDGDQIVHKEALFGSLFFETQEKSGGATGITMGVANPTALIILFFVLTVVLTMIQFTYRGLKQRREQLIKEMSGN